MKFLQQANWHQDNYENSHNGKTCFFEFDLEVEQGLRSVLDAKQQHDDRTQKELLSLRADVACLQNMHLAEVGNDDEDKTMTTTASFFCVFRGCSFKYYLYLSMFVNEVLRRIW